MNSSNLRKLLLLLSLQYTLTIPDQNPSEYWSYKNRDHWGENYPGCNGYWQSPISLNYIESFMFSIETIRLGNYGGLLADNLTLINNGHSVNFAVPATTNGHLPFITGGNLDGVYEAVNVHFHWGSSHSSGSEHVINGVRFDVEMHIVHKNTMYSSIEEALQEWNGLAVLAVMFQIIDDPNAIYPGLNKIFDQLPKVVNYGSSVNITDPMTLEKMLGSLYTKSYFTYSGSLTVPACAESVTWIVFPEPLYIAREHIEKFWSILDAEGKVLINNFRQLQNRNKRPVFYRMF